MGDIHSIIFGFGHKARHGKDTVAAAIKEARGLTASSARRLTASSDPTQWIGKYDIRIYSFAGELKREVNENAKMAGGMRNLFDDGLRIPGAGYMQTTGNFLALPDWVQYDPNPDWSDPLCPMGKQRTLLQWWGTEYRRNADQDYWVNKLKARLAEDKPEIALITDMRFPNEMTFIKEYGDTIKVLRAGAASVNEHISEKALDHVPDTEWSAIIYNTGSLEDLKAMAVSTFDSLMNRQQGVGHGTLVVEPQSVRCIDCKAA